MRMGWCGTGLRFLFLSRFVILSCVLGLVVLFVGLFLNLCFYV